MIRTIGNFSGDACLIFDDELTRASGPRLGDPVDVSVTDAGEIVVRLAVSDAVAEAKTQGKP